MLPIKMVGGIEKRLFGYWGTDYRHLFFSPKIAYQRVENCRKEFKMCVIIRRTTHRSFCNDLLISEALMAPKTIRAYFLPLAGGREKRNE